MNLSEGFIRRPVMTILVMAAILFFGISAYNMLPVSDLPNVDMPTIQVTVSYPGANPETMANAVTSPLEQQFMNINGIETVFSNSNTGSSTIILQFALDRNIDAASTDVQAAISKAQPNLPANLPNQPTYEKVNPAATPILYYVLTSPNMTLADLYDYADRFIGDRLSMIDGVADVITYGSPFAVRVQIDPEKLAAKNIGLDHVTESIQLTNVNLPLGTLYGKRDDFTIDADGQIQRAPGYSELIIKNENGEMVKVKDIGHALDSVNNDKFYQSYITTERSEQCIVIAIQRLPGKNAVKIIQGVKAALLELEPVLPSSLKIEPLYDLSEAVNEGVDGVKVALIFSFILVISVVYLALGKGLNTFIPSCSLPLAIFGTFAAMYLFGFSIDVLSLLALTLSMGFLVDDAIVVIENIVRHTQMGEPPMDAALKGSREISITVLSMTLCLTAAFIPLVFMGGVVGKLFREFAATIIVAVLISGFVSLSLVPMLCSRLSKQQSEDRETRMEKFSNALNERLKRAYEPCLHWAMRHRLIMLGVGLSSIVLSILLFDIVEKDFLPPDDIGFLQGYTQARDGTSPTLMDQYHKQINEISINDPNMESILSISSYTNPNEGMLFLRLKPYKNRQKMNEVVHELSEKLSHIPGVNVYISPIPLIDLRVGTTAQALYQYSLSSLDRDLLYTYAPQIVAKMKENPAFSQVSSDLRINQPQWTFHILRDKASNYNVNATAIENFFQYAYSNNKISQINGINNQYDVLIETLPRFYRDPTVLSKLFVSSTTGHQVPLAEIVEVKEEVGPLTVNHTNSMTSVGISFNPGKNVSLGKALDELHEIALQVLPSQVLGKVIGTADVFKSSFSNLTFLLMLAFFVIYMVLGILYESFIHPLTVMSALPPALLGGLLTLYIFNQTLSIYSFVGLILLIGIVLKNGIMMVDFAIIAVEKGKSAYDAVIEASLTRFRPILMTTFCALVGAIPIALGIGGAIAQTTVSLGLCIVGGLIISQLITLLLTPVLYYYFETLQESLKNKFSRKD